MVAAGERTLSGGQMQGVHQAGAYRLLCLCRRPSCSPPKSCVSFSPIDLNTISFHSQKKAKLASTYHPPNSSSYAPMAAGYSDLEVYHGLPSTAPIEVQEEKIVTRVTTDSKYRNSPSVADSNSPSRRGVCNFCGVPFTRTRVIILVIVLLVIVGGIVAGVVAGVVVSKNSHTRESSSPGNAVSSSSPGISSSSSSQSSSSASSTTPTPSTQESVTVVTWTESVSPTQTLYRDCPSSNNTIYNAVGSNSYQFRKICGRSFKQPPVNVVNQAVASLNDCIDLCAAYNVNNKTEIAAGKSSPCNSVCWRNSATDPDFPGQCFGSTIFNSTAGFQTRDEVICDSGAWINQDI